MTRGWVVIGEESQRGSGFITTPAGLNLTTDEREVPIGRKRCGWDTSLSLRIIMRAGGRGGLNLWAPSPSVLSPQPSPSLDPHLGLEVWSREGTFRSISGKRIFGNLANPPPI